MPDANGNPIPGDPNYLPPTTGLVNTSTPVSSATPATDVATTQYTPVSTAPTTYTAGSYTPNAGSDVAGQVEKIVAKDSPLMQQAAQRARTAMNARGLLNTSMAVGAGQEAVISQALPMAQQQAQQEFQAGATTFQAGEQAKQYEAGVKNKATEFNATSLNTALAAGATQENTARLQTTLANMDNTTKMALATLDAQNRQLLQTNVNAANAYNQTIANIGAIAQNVNMDAAAKAQATQSQLNLLNEMLRTTNEIATTAQADIATLDLGSFFGGGTGGLTP